jgi:hypothetical protein
MIPAGPDPTTTTSHFFSHQLDSDEDDENEDDEDEDDEDEDDEDELAEKDADVGVPGGLLDGMTLCA